MIVLELVAVAVGFGLMVLSSKSAVESATQLAAGSRIPPFVIGVTLLAIGTDLPEFANSVASSVTGHGDVNVGDSVGSAVTQLTLVLGLLPLITGAMVVAKNGIALTGALTVVGLAALAALMSDGDLTRVDALLLIGIWLIGSVLIHRRELHHQQLPLPMVSLQRGRLLGRMLLSFLVLAGAATIALWGVVQLADRFGVPEFLIGFFVAAIGTSLPELVFDVIALRRGQTAMALGDVMGSSFIDVTASVALGPLIVPIDVTRDVVMRGTIVALVAVALVTVLMSRIRDHDWRSGTMLLVIYGAVFIALAVV